MLTAGSIAGIVIGSLVGVFYLYCCCLSARKAIVDRKRIIARNEARRKAKEFREFHRNPEAQYMSNNSEKKKISTSRPNMLAEQISSHIYSNEDPGVSRKISIISIDGQPVHDRATYFGGGAHIASPTNPMNYSFSTAHCSEAFQPPPRRQCSPISPIIPNGEMAVLMPRSKSCGRANSLKRRRSYEMALDEEEGGIPLASTPDRKIPNIGRPPDRVRENSYRRSESRSPPRSASHPHHLTKNQAQPTADTYYGRQSRTVLRETTPRIHVYKAYNQANSPPIAFQESFENGQSFDSASNIPNYFCDAV